MANFADISIRFSADLKQFSSQMENAQRSMKKFGSQLTSVGTGLSVGLTLPLIALGVKSVQAFDKQEKALAQVRQGLISTGNQAKKTLSELETEALKLQNTSLFGDEEILSGVTSQLLTFTNIAGKEFSRTQQAALDLATRLDGDLKSASIQLGKALNDPIANLSALSRSGIQFSVEQKTLINSLASTGRMAEAQTVILDELEKQYGGSAKAAAKAGTGALKQLGNQISDLTEDYGKLISEAILPFVDKVKNVVKGLQGMSDAKKKTVAVVVALAAALGPLLITIGFLATNIIPGLITAFALAKTAFTALSIAIAANPLGALALAVAAVAAAFLIFRDNSNAAFDATKGLNDARKQAAKSVAAEKSQLERLIQVAKDETREKQARLKAIEAINKISPEYLGNITLESINTDKTTASIENYISTLNKKALAQAIEAKQQEAYNALIDENLKAQDRLEKRLDDVTNRIERRRAGQQGVLQGGGQPAPFDATVDRKLLEDQAKAEFDAALAVNTKEYDNYIEKLKAAIGNGPSLQQLINDITNNDTGGGVVGEGLRIKVKAALELDPQGAVGINETVDALEKQLQVLQLTRESYAATSEEYLNLSNAIVFTKQSIDDVTAGLPGTLIPESFYDTTAIDLLTAKLERLKEVGQSVGEAVGDAFETFSNRFINSMNLAKDGFQGFMGQIVQTVTRLISAMLAQSIAQAIAGATAAGTATGPAAILTTPAFIAQAISGVLGAFASIPKFASGGIVSGPTLGIMGEYSGARSNPEVIAPLSKLKALLGDTGAQVFIPQTVLRGQDIVISYERTQNRNNRLK